jgi:hypothetical protein
VNSGSYDFGFERDCEFAAKSKFAAYAVAKKLKKYRVGLSVGFLVLSIFLFSFLSQWFSFQFKCCRLSFYTWR